MLLHLLWMSWVSFWLNTSSKFFAMFENLNMDRQSRMVAKSGQINVDKVQLGHRVWRWMKCSWPNCPIQESLHYPLIPHEGQRIKLRNSTSKQRWPTLNCQMSVAVVALGSCTIASSSSVTPFTQHSGRPSQWAPKFTSIPSHFNVLQMHQHSATQSFRVPCNAGCYPAYEPITFTRLA